MAEEKHPYDYIRIDKGFKKQEYLPLRWLAPELRERILCHDHGSELIVNPAESLWSLGITLWEVATLARHQPFSQVADQCFQTMTAFIGMDLLGPIELQVHYLKVNSVVETLEFNFID